VRICQHSHDLRAWRGHRASASARPSAQVERLCAAVACHCYHSDALPPPSVLIAPRRCSSPRSCVAAAGGPGASRR
jgi:hypothetical protein